MTSVVRDLQIQNHLKRLSTTENNHVTLRQKSIIKKEVHEKGSALDRLEKCKLAAVNGKAKILQREISREERLAQYKRLHELESNEDKITKKAERERAESEQILIKAFERKKQVEKQLKKRREKDEKELESLIEKRQQQRMVKTARIRSLQRDHQRKLNIIRDKWDVNGTAGEKQVNAAFILRDEQIHKYYQAIDRQKNH